MLKTKIYLKERIIYVRHLFRQLYLYTNIRVFFKPDLSSIKITAKIQDTFKSIYKSWGLTKNQCWFLGEILKLSNGSPQFVTTYKDASDYIYFDDGYIENADYLLPRRVSDNARCIRDLQDDLGIDFLLLVGREDEGRVRDRGWKKRDSLTFEIVLLRELIKIQNENPYSAVDFCLKKLKKTHSKEHKE